MVRLILAVTYAMLTSAAFAGGTHEGPEPMRVGEAGSKANVTQTIQVTMKETDDGKMLFTPATMQFRKGQTVKLRIKNIGELDHEFVLDEQAKNTEHRAVMEKFPEMEHDNPNAIVIPIFTNNEKSCVCI